MTKSKIPTLFAIFILLVAIGSIVFTISQVRDFRSSADSGFLPQDVRITNIKDSSVTVSFLTDKPTIGFVEYTNQSGQTLRSDTTNLTTTHYVILQKLSPSTIYSIRINSGGSFFDNNGSFWQIQTTNGNDSLPTSIVSGKILTKENFPARGAIVYVTTDGGINASSLVSASGNFIAAIPSLSDTTMLTVTVFDSISLTATARIDLKSANPMPNIVLGNSYDFKSENMPSATNNPLVPIQLPY